MHLATTTEAEFDAANQALQVCFLVGKMELGVAFCPATPTHHPTTSNEFECDPEQHPAKAHPWQRGSEVKTGGVFLPQMIAPESNNHLPLCLQCEE